MPSRTNCQSDSTCNMLIYKQFVEEYADYVYGSIYFLLYTLRTGRYSLSVLIWTPLVLGM